MDDDLILPSNDDIYIDGEAEEVEPDELTPIDEDDSTSLEPERIPAEIPVDTRENIGSGELGPSDESHTPPADVVVQEVSSYQRVRHQIYDYEPAALKELSDAGAQFYAVYGDGHEEGPIPWTEVKDLAPIETLIDISDDVAAATAQNFWADDNGVHITEEAFDIWATEEENNFPSLSASRNFYNVLLNGTGQLFRRALYNLVSITRVAIAFYDGLGNGENNVMAYFGRNSAQIGRNNEKHVVIDADGVTAYNGNGSLAPMKGLFDGAHINDSSITNSKIKDGTITGSKIADATVTGSKIAASTIENSNIKDSTITGAKIQGSTLKDIPYAEIDELKTRNITSAMLESATGFIGSLTSQNVTAALVQAATAYISSLTAGDLKASDIIADHATVGKLDTNYAKADMANVNNAWIANGTIKEAAISESMIGDLSANKITTGTLNAANVTITNLKAESIIVNKINGQTVTGKSVADALSQHESDISGLDDKIDNQVELLNDRIDGAIETFTGTVVPTLNNAPAVDWNTTKLRDQHVGDVYYVVNNSSQQNGYCYRFTKNTSNNTYSWQLIKDSDVTAALSRLQTAEGKIEQFDVDISNLETETGTLKTQHTTLVTRVDKTLVETVQLWFSKANTTAPSKPTAQVSSTSTAGNAWTTVVPAYNASYPNYFYCYQWKYSDGTFGWSSVTRDIAMGEAQSTSRTAASDASTAKTNASTAVTTANTANGKADTAVSTANTANTNATTALNTANAADGKADTAVSTANAADGKADNAVSTANTANTTASSAKTTAETAKATADKNVKTSVQLWFSKANETAPAKPTSKVTTNNPATGNMWNLAVPTYNASYPKYFYCWQYEHADGTYAWSDIVYDRATTENQANSRSALTQLATKVDSTTFKAVKDTVDEQTTKITNLTTITTNNGLTETTNISNTVNTVSQTVDQHTSKISNLTTTIGANADGTNPSTKSVIARASALEQDLSGFRTTVSSTYATKEALNNLQIGGRNLARKTNWTDPFVKEGSSVGWNREANVDIQFVEGLARIASSYTGRGAPKYGVFTDVAVEPSTEYTISAEVGQEYHIGVSNPANMAWPVDSGGWSVIGNRVYKQYTTSDSQTQIRIYVYGINSTNQVSYVNRVKVEKGNRATDWTPAPEDIETRVSQAESSITQNAANIELKVAKDGVISSINQSAESVKIQAEKVNIEGAAIFTSGKLSKVVTATQTEWYSSTSATSKSGGSWGTTQPSVVAGRFIWERTKVTYSNGTSEYKPSAEGVCTQGQTNLSGYATESFATNKANAVQANLDNLQVGGRNLAKGTSATVEKTGTISSTDTSSYIDICSYTIKRVAGVTEYVASFEAYASVATGITCYWYSPNTTTKGESSTGSSEGYADGHVGVQLTTEWKRYWVKWKQSDSAATDKHLIIGRLGKPSSGSVTVHIRAVKMEVGNRATDWTPAPEDVSATSATATQLIYLQQAEGTTASALNPAKPTTTWVTDATGVSATVAIDDEETTITSVKWTSVRPRYVKGAPLTFVAQQTKFADGHVTTGDAHLDETDTVIDGAHIITGSIDANSLRVSGDLSLDSGTLGFFVGNMKQQMTDANTAIRGKADASDLSGYQTSNDQAVSAINTALGGKADATTVNNLNTQFGTLSQWVYVDSKGGQPVLVMGRQGDQIHMELTNKSLEFIAGSDPLMRLVATALESGGYDSVLEILRAVVVKELRFGDYAFVARKNGNVSLKFIGTDTDE